MVGRDDVHVVASGLGGPEATGESGTDGADSAGAVVPDDPRAGGASHSPDTCAEVCDEGVNSANHETLVRDWANGSARVSAIVGPHIMDLAPMDLAAAYGSESHPLSAHSAEPGNVWDDEADEVSGIDAALRLAELAQREFAAFAEIHDARARERAQEMRDRRRSGGELGPLHGVPVVLKDNVAQAGLSNAAASRVLQANTAAADATIVKRLEASGAVIIGRTNMHELAWGGTTDNPHVGTCRNPWDRRRVPAGSSGGTAAAIAAGVATMGIGTDTGGSIRLPSSVTNLTGLRPTLGAVPTDGVVPLAWSLDTAGPMARDAAQAWLMYQVLVDQPVGAGGRMTPLTGWRPPGRLSHEHRANDRGGNRPTFEGLRVAVPDFARINLEPGVTAAFDACLQELEAAGARISEVNLGPTQEMVDSLVVINAAEASTVYAYLLEDLADPSGREGMKAEAGLIGTDVRDLLVAGAHISAVDYLQAQRFRTYLSHRLNDLWANNDVVLMPTLPFTAPRVGERTVTLGSTVEDNLVANMRFTALASLTGTPALSMPIGRDGDELPIGGQLVGPARTEELLLNVAFTWQQLTDHQLANAPLPLSEL